MDKKEYIKVLRSIQNSLKDSKFNNKEIENFKIEEYYNLLKRTNIRVTSIKLLLSSLTIPLLYENFDNPFPTIVCFIFMTFSIKKYIEKDEDYEKVYFDLKKTKEKYMLESKEIEKIEDIIEFINGLSDEEKNKYLNLKI